MNFVDAISICFKKYVDFSGRARRAEYWYWTLFTVVVSICTSILDAVMFPHNMWSPLNAVFNIAILLPSIAVMVRRLHDTDRSGWWALISLIPIVGWIVLVIWMIGKGTDGPNRFGNDPLAGEQRAPAPAAAA
ncbi:DUF805 domain-containing protein [Caenispirillum salinarum]|uniref:DUF805 domain-containing protein n=1 Tax=Caenispirillum salinarum TaxID=859058 RepID=UPI00384E37A0